MLFWTSIMTKLIFLVNLIYIISLFIAWKYYPAGPVYSGDHIVGENFGVTTWDLIGLLLFSLVTYVFYGMVKNCLLAGLTPGYTLDIFAINLVSQFIISFTRYGWWVYSIVPGYIGWKMFGYVWGYIGRSRGEVVKEEERPVDTKEAKRMAKKERKEERPKMVKVR